VYPQKGAHGPTRTSPTREAPTEPPASPAPAKFVSKAVQTEPGIFILHQSNQKILLCKKDAVF